MNLKFAFKAHVPPGDDSAAMHSHQVTELVYFLTGCGTTTIDGQTYTVKSNCFAVMPAKTEHDQISEETTDTICVGLSDSSPLDKITGVWVDPNGQIKTTLLHFMEELSEQKTGYSMLSQGLLYTAIGLVQRAVKQNAPMDRKQSLVNQAVHIIEEKAGNLSIDDVAGQLFVSKDYLRHLFRHYAGQSPMKTIIKTRIEHAKNLLHNNNLTVNMVAEKCGFENPYYFSRLFKEITGKTPSEFRQIPH
jgi:YesN/AraC family two-component response regulator